MTKRLLEIGFGHCPAVFENGTDMGMFDTYVGVGLPETYGSNPMRDVEYAHENLKECQGKIGSAAVVLANCALLPLPDESIDLVIMRSVLGQYDRRSGLEPSLFETIREFGMPEWHRVLKPGGELFICEENTPYDHGDPASWLETLGFIDVTKIEARPEDYHRDSYSTGDSAWKHERERFYTDTPYGCAGGHWSDMYVLKARKALKNTYREVTHTVPLDWLAGYPPVTPAGAARRGTEEQLTLTYRLASPVGGGEV